MSLSPSCNVPEQPLTRGTHAARSTARPGSSLRSQGQRDEGGPFPEGRRQVHSIRWFGILPDGEQVPRNRHMNGGDWGWDVECSCGWKTRTGGAIQERVREAVAEHRRDVNYEERNTPQ